MSSLNVDGPDTAKSKVGRRWRRPMALIAAFASSLLGLGALSQVIAAPQATAAGSGPVFRLVQVLGKQDRLFVGNGTDSEFRLDFVFEVTAGTVSANGTGLNLAYDYNGRYTGTYGPGIRTDNQPNWSNMNAGNIITTTNLGPGDMNQQYRIIRIDNYGAVDRVTVSMIGDLAGAFDTSNPNGDGSPKAYPVTMQASANIGGTTQYFSYQYQASIYNVSTTYSSQYIKEKVAPILPYDNVFGVAGGNSQWNWGYVVPSTAAQLPSQKMYLGFISPWRDTTAANAANVCTQVNSFYYQWIRSDGTPASITPQPVLASITGMASNGEWGSTALGSQGGNPPKEYDFGAGVDFTNDGPGYYRMVAWPIATGLTSGTS